MLAGLLVFSCTALADPTAQGPAAPGVRTVSAKDACPSAEFAGFLQAFSARSELQRRYTRFPLEFGRLDDADDGYTKSTITSFEKVPNRDPKNGTLFPTPAYIEKFGLKIETFTIKNSKTAKDENVFPEEIISDPAVVTVLVVVPDSGVVVFYRFRKMRSCWFLYAISDRST